MHMTGECIQMRHVVEYSALACRTSIRACGQRMNYSEGSIHSTVRLCKVTMYMQNAYFMLKKLSNATVRVECGWVRMKRSHWTNEEEYCASYMEETEGTEH